MNLFVNENTTTVGGSTATHSKAISGKIGLDWILLRKLVLRDDDQDEENHNQKTILHRADSSLVDKPGNTPVHGGLTGFGKVTLL